MKLYLAITPDRYELPLAVCDSPGELARCYGVSKSCVLSNITHGDSGKVRGAKFIRTEVEEDQ